MKEHAENGSRSLAPAGYGLLPRILYATVRMIYLIVTAAAFPLALHFVRGSRALGLHLPHPVIWIVTFGAAVWIMVYIVLEQYNYPLNLSGAVLMTGSALSSFWSGAALTGFNIGYGAYHMLMGGLAAQLIFFGAVALGYLALKVARHRRGQDLPGIVLGLFWVLTAAYIALALIMIRPLIDAFRGEKNAVYFGLAAVFFCSQVASDLRTLWLSSILNPNVMKDPARNRLHDAWSLPAALALIASMIGAGIIALW